MDLYVCTYRYTHTHKLRRGYYKQVYHSNFDNLYEMDEFLKYQPIDINITRNRKI